jgi:hypothetical protein
VVRLNILTEGQTEEFAVRRVLAPYLAEHDVIAVARSVATRHIKTRYTAKGAIAARVYRGGLREYGKAKGDLDRWLKEDRSPEAFFTTMFDLYSLPADFPDYAAAMSRADPYEKVGVLEDAFYKDINDRRFIPYIQLHEFEALILADPRQLDWLYIEHETAIRRLMDMAAVFGNPELINDNPDTAPSKRLMEEIPEYSKTTAGPLIIDKITIETLRDKCPHFRDWVDRLASLHL